MKITILISIYFSISAVFANSTNVLTEADFIQKVLSQDTNFEKDQIYVNIKQIELDASRQSYAGWNSDLTIGIDNSYYDVEKNTTSTRAYEKNRVKNNQSIKLGTVKKFLSNPGSFDFSISRSKPDNDKARYKQDNYYDNYNISTFNNSYKANYTYPLLKHDSNAESLKTYKRNILDLEREKLDFNDAQEAFLVGRLEQFLLWNLYAKNATIYDDYFRLVKNIRVVKSTDKSKIKTTFFRANKDILDNNSKLQAQIEALVIDLADGSFLTLKPQLDDAKKPHIITNNLESYLHKNVRGLLKDDIDKNLKKIDIKYYKNQNLAQLDFKISAEKFTNKGNTLTTQYDNNGVEYTTNLTFSTPIGKNINNEKDLAVAKLNLRKLQIDYDNAFKDVLSDVRALEVELKLNEKTLFGYQDAINDMAADIQTQYTNYLNKSITIAELLDIYKEKRDIELDHVSTMIDYQQNILKYDDKLDRIIATK